MLVKKVRILVVDDDLESRIILMRLLSLSDYEVETVESGKEAIEQLKRVEFNLVLTDMVMPEVDGLELLSHVKSHYPDIPVIMVTGRASNKSKNEALEKGAEGVLLKPYTKNQLLNIVNESFAKKN